MHQKSCAKHCFVHMRATNKIVVKKLPLVLINWPPITRPKKTVYARNQDVLGHWLYVCTAATRILTIPTESDHLGVSQSRIQNRCRIVLLN